MIVLVKIADMVDVDSREASRALIFQDTDTEESLALEISQEQMQQVVLFVTRGTPGPLEAKDSPADAEIEAPTEDELEPKSAFRIIDDEDDVADMALDQTSDV